MNEGIKQGGQKPFVKGLSKEDLTKISSLIKGNIIKKLKGSWIKASIKAGTVRVPKNIGAMFSLGIFIVAMVSLLIAVNSYSTFSTNKRLENLEKGQAHFETELKEIKDNQARFETEVKKNQARLETKLDQLLARKP